VTSSPYSDLNRPPLRQERLQRALVVPGGLWTSLRVVESTGSTNADVAGAARGGAPEGLVWIAERQLAGRGRLGRTWQSPARAGIAVSVLFRPGTPTNEWPAVPIARYGWLPLLAGVALVRAVRRVSEVDARLKWPNDLLIDEYKCAGILAEGIESGAAVVVGIGLNVNQDAGELPHPLATSLSLAGATSVDRDPLLRALLRELADQYSRWRVAGGDPEACGLRERYQRHCATLGAEVRVALPGDGTLCGTAESVDRDGRLIVRGHDGAKHALAAGDVVHLRVDGSAATG
jgi:BirA family biotin operon repressor/biotin-[acetyl-CoA-carboxylase] ligase